MSADHAQAALRCLVCDRPATDGSWCEYHAEMRDEAREAMRREEMEEREVERDDLEPEPDEGDDN